MNLALGHSLNLYNQHRHEFDDFLPSGFESGSDLINLDPFIPSFDKFLQNPHIDIPTIHPSFVNMTKMFDNPCKKTMEGRRETVGVNDDREAPLDINRLIDEELSQTSSQTCLDMGAR